MFKTLEKQFRDADYAGSIAQIPAVVSAWVAAPAQVASVVPSSRTLTRCVANRSCVRRASTVVDLGPGTGGTTRALLKQMSSDSQILAIEKTASFIEPLHAINDQRLIAVHGDAVDIAIHLHKFGKHHADVIVSGIPFSSIVPATAGRIMDAIFRALPCGGTFIAYQLRSDVVRWARPLFGEPTSERVWWNLPPLTVHCWTKS